MNLSATLLAAAADGPADCLNYQQVDEVTGAYEALRAS